MGDAVRRSFAALATSPPNTTLSQNNGIVALTRCASTHAGYACGFRLLIFRMIATVGAWILSIPDFVLGGALTFLFANIILFGIKLIAFDGISRGTTYIVASSPALGVGTTLVPAFSAPGIGSNADRLDQWWPSNDDMSDFMNSLRGHHDFHQHALGSITAIILNLVIPLDLIDGMEVEDDDADDDLQKDPHEEKPLTKSDPEMANESEDEEQVEVDETEERLSTIRGKATDR